MRLSNGKLQGRAKALVIKSLPMISASTAARLLANLTHSNRVQRPRLVKASPSCFSPFSPYRQQPYGCSQDNLPSSSQNAYRPLPQQNYYQRPYQSNRPKSQQQYGNNRPPQQQITGLRSESTIPRPPAMPASQPSYRSFGNQGYGNRQPY